MIAYLALHYLAAIQLAAHLQSVAPLFVALWSFILFRDRLTLMQASGIAAISMTGALVIICRGGIAVLARSRSTSATS